MVKYKQQKPKPQHNMTKRVGRTAYVCCWHCGLIRLNNEATQKAINKGCVDDQEEIINVTF